MKKILLIAVAVAVFGKIASARQDSTKTHIEDGEWQSWLTAYLKKQFTINHSATLRFEQRTRKNFTDPLHFSGEFRYSFHPRKWFALGTGYRIITKGHGRRENKFFATMHLFCKLRSFSFAYRFFPEYEYTPFYIDAAGKHHLGDNALRLRNKFWIKFDSLGKFTPYIAAEPWYQVLNSERPKTDGKWFRSRWEAGMHYSINCTSSFTLYGLLQHEWNMPADDQKVLYVIGLTYFYKFAWKLCEDEHVKYDAAD